MRSRSAVSLAALVLFLGGLGAGIGAALVFGPNTAGFDRARSVTLPEEPTLETAIDSLEGAGILGSAATFRLIARGTGWGSQLKSGHYKIEPRSSNYRMLDQLRRGLQTPVQITIPPGIRPDVFASVVSRRLKLDGDTLRATLRDTSLARSLGTTPRALFGYMLPETYEFYWQTSAETVIRRVKKAFDRFYERKLARPADSVGLGKQELVTLASIVEWEALLDEEKATIAGVYLNRLRRGWPLQADPTIQFVLIDTEGKRVNRVLYEHLEIDHPYNTYETRGLPPGPITNPAPSTLRATAHAEDHRYFYFAADGSGGHTFSRTLREHNRAAQKYQRQFDNR